MTPPLTRPCPLCEDGIRWASRWGGNDPDVWQVGTCDNCGGTSVLTLRCEGVMCQEDATRMVGNLPFCEACAVIEEADIAENEAAKREIEQEKMA